MTLLAGPQWRDFFDVIFVQARKPKFFTDESRPIRLYDEKTNSHVWDRVSKLEKGKIYYEVKCYHYFFFNFLISINHLLQLKREQLSNYRT